MKNNPMTILITVGKKQGYIVAVKLGSAQTLYTCEGVQSLFDRLIRILGLPLKCEIQVKEK